MRHKAFLPEKNKCKKTTRKRLKGHPFLEVKSLYNW